MNSLVEENNAWLRASNIFKKIIESKKLKIGAEIGVAYGDNAENILTTPQFEKLYGIDPYLHMEDYQDPMNLPQVEFDELYEQVLERLSKYGDKYLHIRKLSSQAVNDVPDNLDFVYIDADHSYKGVWNDLCHWFKKVRTGGIIAGHDFGHPSFPGVQKAVKEFFRRLEWIIYEEGEGVWWVEKKPLNISFFIPAYNCEKTIEETVESILQENFGKGDELIIVNDYSEDNSKKVLTNLKEKVPFIKIINHDRNKGGGAARNTAIENSRNPILFCLDSDNILVPNSIKNLKEHLIDTGADVASFQEIHYFKENKNEITHKWKFKDGLTTLSDYLAGPRVPGASGNYMFTKESWLRAGGYPEYAKALDSWGFGLHLLATGSKMRTMPNSFYYHRYGHESYWIRFSKKENVSLVALQLLIPFLDLIHEKDVDYIMSRRGRNKWFSNMERRPIRVKDKARGKKAKRILAILYGLFNS